MAFKRGSHGHDHATAKIDYILANKGMLRSHRFHDRALVVSSGRRVGPLPDWRRPFLV